MLKYNSKGVIIWQYGKVYSGEGSYIIENLISDSLGNIFICEKINNGTFTSYNTNYSIIEINNQGNEILIYKSPLVYLGSDQKIYKDNNGNILVYTTDSDFNKLSIINSIDSLELLYFTTSSIFDIAFESTNHIHLLTKDKVIELLEDGTVNNTVFIPSLTPPEYANRGKLKIIEVGDSINYLVFLYNWNNYYSILKTNQIGKIIFQKNGTLKTSVNKYYEDNLILYNLPSNDIVYGPVVDSIPFESDPSSSTSLVVYILDTKGNDKIYLNLYSNNTTKYTTNENFIFS